VDARDRLREYLEQRRELGESEFVLDGLSVDEALSKLGVRGGGGGASKSGGHAPPHTPQHESPREARVTGPVGGDWREALRSVGVDQPGKVGGKKSPNEPVAAETASHEPAAGSEPEKVGRYEMPKTAPVTDANAELKAGLVVGSAAARTENSPLAHLDSIEAVAKAVASCTLCALHASARNPVPGEGNPHAGLVCVGEAPGATEDELGRPFVGQSGQLLTKILAAIKFEREDVFICNVLKHRPPANRNPSTDEIAVCSPYLLRQLELLKPRVILALGTFAAQTLLQTTQPIGKLRGQVHRYYGVPLIVTYHPAALLRNPSWKRSTWEDVQLARRIFDSAPSGA
jgi:DNA polymerase